MRSHRSLIALVGALGVSTAVIAASSCGGGAFNSTTSGGHTTGTGGHGGSGGASSGTAGSGGTTFVQPDGGCQTSTECDGGVCVGSMCCDASRVCGETCCTGSTVCLFDACVTPGNPCHTANDCGPGQYCETALGSTPDGGVPDAGPDGGLCLQPLPLGGKCLPLPPVCDPDAGPPGPDAGCIADCEYHPVVAPQLDAVEKWQWGPTAQANPNFTDVWSTPAVGRIYDGNCDGVVDELDSPNIVFVAGKAIDTSTGKGTCCQCTGAANSACLTGVLRMLDGRTGQEIWSLDKASPTSIGFAGLSVAIGDVDKDGRVDIAAVTGEGFVVLIDANGNVTRTSNLPIPGHGNATFGWGGGLAIADMDGDGFPEIAYGSTVFSTTNGAITLKFTGTAGVGAENIYEALSTFVDLDGAPDNHLELLAGNTAYNADGSILWHNAALPDGFSGVGDFDLDGKPEAVLVSGGHVWILNGATGAVLLGGAAGQALPGTGSGGPPTIADFDGDGKPEIGVAMATFYSMVKPNFTTNKIDVIWQTPNHDLSSSVTGSSVFDFEGDGKAEVIYADECFLWVFDGATGHVRFATPHTSFTATEASLLADVDGDGHADMVMVSNGSDPSAGGSWPCNTAPWNQVSTDPNYLHPAWVAPPGAPAYRGITVFSDVANSWVGTRTLWSEHTYHVTNICDDRDTACAAPNVYGSIPVLETKNWSLPWANDFRQNVQDKGIFDAPDATVSLSVDCTSPVLLHASVRNIGLASLPSGVDVGLFKRVGSVDTQVGQATTTHALFPGQTEEVVASVDPSMGSSHDVYVAKILVDPNMPTFHECRTDNDDSDPVSASCVQ